MNYSDLFKMPTPSSITGKSSVITNSFINSIIPIIKPTSEDIEECLKVLGMNLENFGCSYCGNTATEWDHFRPLVLNKRPTGYISEIQNLVPACGKCNQSKGNKNWTIWMLSDAKLSPKTRKVKCLDLYIERLKRYELWREPTQIDFEEILGKELWEQHWNNCTLVQSTMKKAQILASEINSMIEKSYRK